MVRFTIALALFLLAHPSAVVAAGAETSASTAEQLQALKHRISALTVKGWQAINMFFLISRQSGGYRVLFAPLDSKTATEEQKLFVDLYVVAGLTKGTSEIVCSHRATKSLCTGRFDPSWRVEPNTVYPTVESLVAWTNETENALVPLWTGLCRLTREKDLDADYCPSAPQ